MTTETGTFEEISMSDMEQVGGGWWWVLPLTMMAIQGALNTANHGEIHPFDLDADEDDEWGGWDFSG